MMRTFYNGVSGVKTHSYGMDLLANNISNINTAGYKAAIPEFKDLLYQSSFESGVNLPANQVGLAATGLSSAFSQKQGYMQTTDRELDVAISGRGFFGIKDLDGRTYYTRNGAFGLDAQANLVDSFGRYVVGTMNEGFSDYAVDDELAAGLGIRANRHAIAPAGDIALKPEAAQGAISLPPDLVMPHVATTEVKIRARLDESVQNVHKNTPIAGVQQLQREDGGYELVAIPEGAAEGDEVIFTLNRGKGLERIAARVGADGAARLALDEKIDEGEETGDGAEDTGGTEGTEGTGDAEGTEGTGDGTDGKRDVMDRWNDTSGPRFSAVWSHREDEPALNKFEAKIIDAAGHRRHLKIEISKDLAAPGREFSARAVITNAKGEELAAEEGRLVFNDDGSLRENSLEEITGIALNFGRPVDKTPPAPDAPEEPDAPENPETPDAPETPEDIEQPTGFEGLVASGEERATSISADGVEMGLLRGYSVDELGNIQATFTNGRQSAVAKLAVFQFINEQGLEKHGESEFAQTVDSGAAHFFRQNGEVFNPARIAGNTLEMSNVDLGNELTSVIMFQKAYEASAKSISTADQMLKRAIEMKK